MTPVFAVLLAIVILGERIRGPQLLALAAIVVGITLMYRGQVSLSGRSIVGIEEVFAPVRTIATVIRGTLVRVRV